MGQATSEGSDFNRLIDTANKAAVKPTTALTRKVFDPEISLVGDVKSIATQAVKLRNVLAEIKDGAHKKQVDHIRTTFTAHGKNEADDLKKRLPGVLFSGRFIKRATDGLDQHSGIICVDIDGKENRHALDSELSKTRSEIESDPHVLAVFVSPSGTGLKVLCRCDSNRPHIESFRAASRHFADKFGLVIDGACKDVSRLCFLSYDPELFTRDDCLELPCKPEDLVQVSQPLQFGKVRAMPPHFGAMNKDQVRGLLADIPPKPAYPDWLKILSAVFSVLSFEDGCEVLEDWSPEKKSGGYAAKYRKRLKEIGPGTLVYYAQLGGGKGTLQLAMPAAPASGRPFTLWAPSQFISHQPAVGRILLDKGYLVRGEMTSFLGVGGLGKTRMALWLAICQITGKNWCDLPTTGTTVTWLFLSTESGISRWKNDLSLMMGGLSSAEKKLVEAHLLALALVPDEDSQINFGVPDSNARLVATLNQVKPGVIVFDPFADMIDGDENATADVVKTLRNLSSIHKTCASDAAILIVHHSRTGAANVVQAGDNFSSGNFGRGSKALYSRVRCELQLAPGDRDDPTKLVLSCGKANDCEKFAVRGVIFDPQTCTYSCDPSFDVQAWRDDLNGKRRSQLVSIADVVCAVRDTISAGGSGTAEASTAAIAATLQPSVPGCVKTITRRLNESLTKGYIVKGSRRGLWALGPKANLIP